MRIGIDVQSTLGKKTGIGHYASQLVRALEEIDSESEYVYLHNGNSKPMRVPQRLFWDQFCLPLKAVVKRLNVLHSPGFSPPILHHCKLVVTVHDLIGMIFPMHLGFFSRYYWGKWLPFAAKRANMIIADSECTKRDIEKYLKVKSNKIVVVHLGVAEEFQPITEKRLLTAARKKYRLEDDYILHVGAIEPRKNLGRLVKAFCELKRKFDVPHKLVLAGGKEWAYESLVKLIRYLDLEEEVIFTGYVDEADLPKLYSAASAFVFPSLYEGFGMPALEAMACGVPTIASNTSSIPEVVSNAGILVDPYNVQELTSAMHEVLHNQVLRKNLARKGIDRARKFSWLRVATETLKVYRNV